MRFVDRVRAWIRRAPQPVRDDERFATYVETDPLLIVTSLDPIEVGRQRSCAAAITDTVAWLEVSGFDDVDRGDLQRYALFLLEMRAAYERGVEVLS